MSELKGLHHVLDYGCGVGHKYRAILKAHVDRYTGADISSVALASVRESGDQALAIQPDTGAIDAINGAFDGAICSEVFEHLFDPLRAAREIHRVLAPGAPFIVTVPNFGYHAWRLLAFLRARVPDEPEDPATNPFNGVHIRYFSAWTLRRMLTMAGFERVNIGVYVHGSIWDVFQIMGPLHHVSRAARRCLPQPFHLGFLANLFPGVFAERLRAIAYKPAD